MHKEITERAIAGAMSHFGFTREEAKAWFESTTDEEIEKFKKNSSFGKLIHGLNLSPELLKEYIRSTKITAEADPQFMEALRRDKLFLDAHGIHNVHPSDPAH